VDVLFGTQCILHDTEILQSMSTIELSVETFTDLKLPSRQRTAISRNGSGRSCFVRL